MKTAAWLNEQNELSAEFHKRTKALEEKMRLYIFGDEQSDQTTKQVTKSLGPSESLG